MFEYQHLIMLWIRGDNMTTVQEIQNAITSLPKDKFQEFRAWFEEYEAKLWDKEFERDVIEGKLDSMAKKALEEHEAGRCRKI